MGDTAVSLTLATYYGARSPLADLLLLGVRQIRVVLGTASLSLAMTSFSVIVDIRTSCFRSVAGGLEVSAASATLTGSACGVALGPTLSGFTGAGSRDGGCACVGPLVLG